MSVRRNTYDFGEWNILLKHTGCGLLTRMAACGVDPNSRLPVRLGRICVLFNATVFLQHLSVGPSRVSVRCTRGNGRHVPFRFRVRRCTYDTIHVVQWDGACRENLRVFALDKHTVQQPGATSSASLPGFRGEQLNRQSRRPPDPRPKEGGGKGGRGRGPCSHLILARREKSWRARRLCASGC
jgi:hypothetical protein